MQKRVEEILKDKQDMERRLEEEKNKVSLPLLAMPCPIRSGLCCHDLCLSEPRSRAVNMPAALLNVLRRVRILAIEQSASQSMCVERLYLSAPFEGGRRESTSWKLVPLDD